MSSLIRAIKHIHKENITCNYYTNNQLDLFMLWEAAIKNDEQAYTLLYTNLYPALYGYVLQTVKDSELTNDLLQELFVKLWHKREQIGAIKNVKAYFFAVSKSMIINHFRKIKSQNTRLENFIQPEIDFSAEDIMVSAEENQQLKYKMQNALNTLPARQREIIRLKYFHGMEYQMIAEVTGIHYQSVINHVFRGLRALRAQFRQFEVKVAV